MREGGGDDGADQQGWKTGFAEPRGESPEITGAQLAEVLEGGPADKAGWKSGDVITSINGQPVSDRGVFRLILSIGARARWGEHWGFCMCLTACICPR